MLLGKVDDGSETEQPQQGWWVVVPLVLMLLIILLSPLLYDLFLGLQPLLGRQ